MTSFRFRNRTNDCRTVPHDNEELPPSIPATIQPLSSLYRESPESNLHSTRLALCFFEGEVVEGILSIFLSLFPFC